MSDEEELECLHRTVENIKEKNIRSIFKGKTGRASESKTWIEKLQSEELKWEKEAHISG